MMHVEMCFVYVHLFTPRKILSAAIYLIPGESLKVETSGKLEGGNQFVYLNFSIEVKLGFFLEITLQYFHTS